VLEVTAEPVELPDDERVAFTQRAQARALPQPNFWSLSHIIEQKFGVVHPVPGTFRYGELKRADIQLLVDETAAIMAQESEAWPPNAAAVKDPTRIKCWPGNRQGQVSRSVRGAAGRYFHSAACDPTSGLGCYRTKAAVTFAQSFVGEAAKVCN
jgi:hypothetical protein